MPALILPLAVGPEVSALDLLGSTKVNGALQDVMLAISQPCLQAYQRCQGSNRRNKALQDLPERWCWILWLSLQTTYP